MRYSTKACSWLGGEPEVGPGQVADAIQWTTDGEPGAEVNRATDGGPKPGVRGTINRESGEGDGLAAEKNNGGSLPTNSSTNLQSNI